MKIKILVALLCLPVFGLWAQSEVEKKVKQEIWGTPSKEFSATTVPDKWKNESAVILAMEQVYLCDFATKVSLGMGVTRQYVEKINRHTRIKLLDKAAVQDYSEFSFNNKVVKTNLFGRSSRYSLVGIKVVKSNGTEKEVDLSEAVKTDITTSRDLKIPIPNLEEGDIVDYFFEAKDESLSMPSFGDYEILSAKYPIVTSTMQFKLPHEVYFFSNSFNGAPEFTKEKVDRDVIYTMKDEMREKEPSAIWSYEYRSAPHVRYKITGDSRQQDMSTAALDLLDRIASNNVSDIGFIVDYIEGNFKKEKDQVKIVKEIYYLLRNPIYLKAYFDIEQSHPLNAGGVPNLYFFLLTKVLKKYKIDHELMLAPSREFGPMKDLVNFSPCDFVVKVKTDPPFYLSRPAPFNTAGDVAYSLEGMEYVSRGTSTDAKIISASGIDDNVSSTTFHVKLDPTDKTKINIDRTIVAKGHSKTYHQYLVFTDYDYLKEYDQSKYQVQSSFKLRELIKNYNAEKTKFEQRITQDYTKRDEGIKEAIETDMDVKVSEYKNLSIKNIGMWDQNPDTEYSDAATIETMVKKAGPNLIVDLGKLIGKQTDLKKENKTRTTDIYQSYPRTIVNEIVFTLPDGYVAEGMEGFNKKVENETGGFVSTVVKEGNKLRISCRKFYKKNYYPAAEWPKLANFLNAASDFTEAKLLLKKK